MYACLHGDGDLITLAAQFSPIIEATSPNTVTFNVAGLERLFGLPQDIAAAIHRRAGETGVRAALALAANPDAAICAARGFPGVHVLPHNDEGKFLAPLPVTLLEPSPELLETLTCWGIRRFGELGALPPLGIAERLGPEGLRMRTLARGEAERKLRTIDDPLRFEDEIDLEYPVALLEPLAFLLARLINGLATALAARTLATDEVRLRLRLEDRTTHERTLRLPVPSLDTKAFLKLMQLDLEAHLPPAPVVHLWMGVKPVKPQTSQSGLFIPAVPEPVKLELTLARIRAIVGRDRVGVPRLDDTHRPDAFHWKNGLPGTEIQHSARQIQPRLALRVFRPPRAATVALSSGQPGFVHASNIRGKVVEFAGPWRTSGDWWTADAWQRDEWDVALSDGALYLLSCTPYGWFVDGSYD